MHHMDNSQRIAWVLRIAVAGEFLGHGVFALQGKKAWIGWIQQLSGVDMGLAAQLLFLVGLVDVLVAVVVLVRPIRLVLLWATFWGFWTAFVRLLVGEPIFDFIERFANWGAPLALLLLIGLPKKLHEWFK